MKGLAEKIREIKNRRVEYQCEKCGFIDTNTQEESELLPESQKQYLLNHRQKCGGRFLPHVFLSENDVLAVVGDSLQELVEVVRDNQPTKTTEYVPEKRVKYIVSDVDECFHRILARVEELTKQ